MSLDSVCVLSVFQILLEECRMHMRDNYNEGKKVFDLKVDNVIDSHV